GTTTQLTVYTTRLVTLRTDDGQTSCLDNLFGKLDVGTTTGHVGSDGHLTRTTSLRNNLCLFLVKLSIQYVMFNARSEEHTSELQSRENLVCRLLLEKTKIH